MGNLGSVSNAASGLRVAQRGLAATGHNMSNVNTLGFSRQQIMQQDFGSRSIGVNHFGTMQVGLGADVASVRQIRDRFLDSMFRQEIGRANFYETIYRAGVDIELTMGELISDHSTQAVTGQIWESIQELTLNASGIDARSNFVSANITYINRMNDTQRRLREQQNILNGEVKETVARVNELVNMINDLNGLISRAESAGQRANDFRDVRNNAIDELSSLIDIDYRENMRGVVEISTGGHQLLANSVVSNIGLRFTQPGQSFVEPVITPTTSILPYDPTYSNAISLFRFDRPLPDDHRDGKLKGLIMARGLFDATHDSLNRPQPNRDDPVFHIDNGDGTTTFNNVAFRNAMETFNRREFNSLHTTIPRTLRHMDTLFHHTVTMINDYLTRGYDLNGQPGVPIFQIINPNRPENSDFPIDPNDPDCPNRRRAYTLGNVVINPVLLNPQGYNNLGFAQSPESGREDAFHLLGLLEAWDAPTISFDGNAEMNLNDLYSHMITTLSTETARVSSVRDTQLSITNDVDNRRMQASAVSLDEEMTNMIQFQHAFNAASRAVSTIDSMIETLLRTGRAGT